MAIFRLQFSNSKDQAMAAGFNRRAFLNGVAGSAIALAASACGAPASEARTFRVRYSEAEWRRRLTPAQFRILREEGTERPFSSPLNAEHRTGTFTCAADGNRLFASRTKFDSGTGWPSFYQPLPGAIGTSTDFKLGYPRTAVFCSQCGGHLGHVFDDGPRPTGKRYCMNGAAMAFVPA